MGVPCTSEVTRIGRRARCARVKRLAGVVVCLNDLVYRQKRYTAKDFAAAVGVDRSLATGWLTGRPAPLAKHITPLTASFWNDDRRSRSEGRS